MDLFDFDYEPQPTSASVAAVATPIAPPKPQLQDIADSDDWLFADGGCIGRNPSTDGVTWAWVRVCNGVEVARASGVLLPSQIGTEMASNNNAELHALCRGILALPDDWSGTVASDSGIALGWVFLGYKQTLVPDILRRALACAQRRGGHLPHLLLAGHPKPADIAAGMRVSKAPHYPVSRWNVLCDALCTEQAKQFQAVRSIP